MEVVCGFQNPEDLALLPDGQTIVVSQSSTTDSAPGNLAFFKTGDSWSPTPSRNPGSRGRSGT